MRLIYLVSCESYSWGWKVQERPFVFRDYAQPEEVPRQDCRLHDERRDQGKEPRKRAREARPSKTHIQGIGSRGKKLVRSEQEALKAR